MYDGISIKAAQKSKLKFHTIKELQMELQISSTIIQLEKSFFE